MAYEGCECAKVERGGRAKQNRGSQGSLIVLPHPMILLKRERKDVSKYVRRNLRDEPKEANEIDEGETDLPSVMDLQAKYKTPTAAVSRAVATKEPSNFDSEVYEKKRVSNLVSLVN